LVGDDGQAMSLHLLAGLMMESHLFVSLTSHPFRMRITNCRYQQQAFGEKFSTQTMLLMAVVESPMIHLQLI